MEITDLKKFITENNIEYHWRFDNVYIVINNNIISEWYSLLEPSIFNDEDDGIECWMKDGYFTFEMKYICEYYNIEMRDVFR